MKLFSRKKEESVKHDVYEEIHEKKTSKLGYIFLFFMFALIVGFGQTIFGDIRQLVERPMAVPNCLNISTDNLRSVTGENCRSFGRYGRTHDGESAAWKYYQEILPALSSIYSLNTQLQVSNRDLTRARTDLERLQNSYDLNLQETIAGQNPLESNAAQQSLVRTQRDNINRLERQQVTLTKERDNAISAVSPQIQRLKSLYTSETQSYKSRQNVYEFKVLLLALLFVVPFFVLSLYFYFKLKRRDSAHTIILTAVVAAFGILFLQVVFWFLGSILPWGWLVDIFAFFKNIPALRFILYYGTILLVIGLFGGLVYYIQKRVFNPRRVGLKRLRDGKCPQCSFVMHQGYNYCPKCQLQLREKCTTCGNGRIRILDYCMHCGRLQHDAQSQSEQTQQSKPPQ